MSYFFDRNSFLLLHSLFLMSPSVYAFTFFFLLLDFFKYYLLFSVFLLTKILKKKLSVNVSLFVLSTLFILMAY